MGWRTNEDYLENMFSSPSAVTWDSVSKSVYARYPRVIGYQTLISVIYADANSLTPAGILAGNVNYSGVPAISVWLRTSTEIVVPAVTFFIASNNNSGNSTLTASSSIFQYNAQAIGLGTNWTQYTCTDFAPTSWTTWRNPESLTFSQVLADVDAIGVMYFDAGFTQYNLYVDNFAVGAPATAYRFLSLPFDEDHVILQGWRYDTPIKPGEDPFRHEGVDYAVPLGTNILAAASGRAKSFYEAGEYAYGNYVVVEHENGSYTLYAHLETVSGRINSDDWTQVSAGDIIGASGAGGGVPHLHFELSTGGWGQGYRVDPYGIYSTVADYTLENMHVAAQLSRYWWIDIPPGSLGTVTWYVDAAISQSGDGRSPETAFKTIREGIDASSDRDTVIVAPGTYVENILFKGKNIILTGANSVSPAAVSTTIIDGNQAGSVVTFSGSETESCTLAGFTIRNGEADYGGGICGGTRNNHTRATIRNNRIIGNSAQEGGALCWCDGTIQNNLICGNHGHLGGGLSACHGMVRSNTITGNTADEGGGLYGCGGDILNSIIWRNEASQSAQLHASAVPTYSCIENWTGGGEGNISKDPHFADPDGPDNNPGTYEDNDYRLSVASPCIDVGLNEDWMWMAGDLDGNPRIFYGKRSLTVDMGTYEYASFLFKVTQITYPDGGNVQLTWNSRTGETYTVWSSDNLSAGIWVQGASVPSQGTSTSWTDASPVGRDKFYRIEIK